jgi:serine/threonine-protein kinase
MIGSTLDGRYNILSLLGEGGMGKVYLAEHVALEKRMAVKVLHAEYSRQEEVTKRFQQEAIAASRIGQENIVNVTDFGRTPDGALYFVMEELAGENLGDIIRAGPLPAARTIPLLAQVGRALGAAHARGIVHRDLKPDNVIVLQREERPDFVKVVDFGISKVGSTGEGRPREKLTRLGTLMGTPEYMAPEQAGGGTVDHRVDIYAFGVMAYEMLTATLPFSDPNPLAVLVRHQSVPPEPPSKRRPDLDIPPSLEALVLRCMQKGPDARPQQMSEVLAELSGCAQELGLSPISVAAGALRDRPQSAPPHAPALAATVMRPTPATLNTLNALDLRALGKSWRRWVPAIGAGLALLLLAVVFLTRSRPERPIDGTRAALGPTVALPTPAAATPVAAPATAPNTLARPAQPEESPSPQAATLHVMLKTSPSGAQVLSGRATVGVTPLEVELAKGASVTYRFRLAGYRTETRRVSADERSVDLILKPAPRRNGGTPYDSDDELKGNPFR